MRETNEELTQKELKNMAGGLNGDAIHPRKKASFSQRQTIFTEIGSIKRNAGFKKDSNGILFEDQWPNEADIDT